MLSWLTLIQAMVDTKKLLRVVAGAASAIAMGIVLQQFVETRHNEAKAWTNEAKAEIIQREDQRYAEFKQELGDQKTDIKQIRGWLWELVQAKRSEGNAPPEKSSLKEGGQHGR